MGEEGKKKLGRPLKLTAEQVKRRAKRYFEEVPQIKWTITGCALFLGFNSRQQMIEYGEREDFHYTIRQTKARIEQDIEEDCKRRGNSGDIFRLKNFNWKDKTEVALEHSGSINLGDLTDE